MARKVFYSFHYKPDNWRVSQVRNIGAIEDNKPAKDNDWEAISNAGDAKIKEWIDGQMTGRSCAVVLVGENTSGRKWINYEIESAWNSNKGLVGIYIHNLKNSSGQQSNKGSNPFSTFIVGEDKKALDKIVKCYDPPFLSSSYVYDHIKENLEGWIEEAIAIREKY